MIGNYLKYIVLIAITGSCNVCFGQNDWNKYGLHGRVKTYLELQYTNKKHYAWDMRMTFDANGNYQWMDFFEHGKLIPVRENGKIVEFNSYSDKGGLLYKTKVVRISSDTLVYTYSYLGEKKAEWKEILINNRVFREERKEFEGDSVTDKYFTSYEYDPNGMLISKKTDKQGKVTVSTYTYDNEGNLLIDKQTDPYGHETILRYKYLSFDEHRNWTRRREYDSREGTDPAKVVVREYEYY